MALVLCPKPGSSSCSSGLYAKPCFSCGTFHASSSRGHPAVVAKGPCGVIGLGTQILRTTGNPHDVKFDDCQKEPGFELSTAACSDAVQRWKFNAEENCPRFESSRTCCHRSWSWHNLLGLQWVNDRCNLQVFPTSKTLANTLCDRFRGVVSC